MILFISASVERFGPHEFAATLPEHNVNAKKYSDWINSQGVKIVLRTTFGYIFFISSRFSNWL
jgi:hypothetical protein